MLKIRLQDFDWLLALGFASLIGGISGYPGFGFRSDDRLYLTVGTLFISLGLLFWREQRYGRG